MSEGRRGGSLPDPGAASVPPGPDPTLQTTDPFVHEPGREPDAERLRELLAVHRWLGETALDGDGLDAIATAIYAAVGGSVLIIGTGGRPLARHDPGGLLDDQVAGDLGRALAARDDLHPRIVDHPALNAAAYVRPIPAPRGSHARAWLVVATADGQVDELVRLVVQGAAAIVGLELKHQGVASETERRLTANLVGDAIGGRTDPAELGRRLEAFGMQGEVAVAVFAGAGAATEGALQATLAALDVAAAVSTQEVGGRELLCALVAVGDRDPIEVAVEARRRLIEEVGVARETVAAVSRARPAPELPRTFQEAYWALGAVEHRLAGGAGEQVPAPGRAGSRADPKVGSWQDLGVEALLLAVADEDVLHLYCDRLLGPMLAGDSAYAAELLHSLELFILHNGQWERAARELHCHRHTLRYRMRKLEEMTGRDLGKATDRIEFWLALRARELTARSAGGPHTA
jgi:PucR family transcriptional regulator, purine catabolism regulatory protein